MVQLDTATPLHHVCKNSQLILMSSAARPKVAFWRVLVFGMDLVAKCWPGIVGLVAIGFLFLGVGSASLGQSPSRHVLLAWRFGARFWEVSAWSHAIWGRGENLHSSSPSETESIFFSWFVNGFFFRQVLRARLVVHLAAWESRLSSNFRSQRSSFSRQVCLDRVIKEQSVFVKIIFWFHFGVSCLSAHRPLGRVFKLNGVLVLVSRTWRLLSSIFNLSQLSDIQFLSFISLCLREVIVWSSGLIR